MARHRRPSRRERAARPAKSTSLPASRPVRADRPAPAWLEPVLRRGIWITLAAAAVVRLLHWILVRSNDPFYAQTFRGFDMHTYWTWAQSLVKGDWLSREFTNNNAFYYGPMYAYFLGIVFKVFGESYNAVHGLQALLGTVSPVLLYSACRRLFGNGAALATGLLAAVCAPIVFYEQTLLMEGLLVLTHTGILWMLIRGQSGGRGSWAWALGAGALSGMACWGRGNFLLVIPLLAVAWVAIPVLLEWPVRKKEDTPEGNAESPPEETHEREKRPSGAAAERESMRRRWKAGVLCAAAFSISAGFFLSIPLARNLAIANSFVVTTSNGPILLYIGNAHDSTGIFSYPPSYEELVAQYPSQFDVPWKKELTRDMLQRPGSYVGLMFKKVWMFWNSYDVADNVGYYVNKRYSWVFRWSPVTWLTLVPLAVLGVWHTRRQWRRQMLMYVYAIGFALSIIAVFVVGRYRLEEVLPMLIWSGAAAAVLVRQIWNRHWNGVALEGVIIVAAVALLWPRWSPAVDLNTPEGLPEPFESQVHLTRANDYNTHVIALTNLERWKETRDLLEEAVEAYPWYQPLASRLGSILIQDGDFDEAILVLRNSLRASGGDLRLLVQLGEALARAGRTSEARSAFETALRADPENAQARAWLDRLAPKQ